MGKANREKQVQLAKPYYYDYLAVTEPLFVKPREVKLSKRVGEPFVMTEKSIGGFLE